MPQVRSSCFGAGPEASGVAGFDSFTVAPPRAKVPTRVPTPPGTDYDERAADGANVWSIRDEL
jgi:hypothetical protein